MAGDETVASIHVRVRPDTSKFADELRRKLEGIERKAKADIPVSADTKAFQAEVKAAVKRASDEVVRIRVDYGDITSVQKSVGQLQKELKKLNETPISMTLDEDAIKHELDRLLDIDNAAFEDARKRARSIFENVGTINPDLDRRALAKMERDLRKTFERIAEINLQINDANLSKRARADLAAELADLHASIELDKSALSDIGDSVREALELAGDNANFARLSGHVQEALDGIKLRPDFDADAKQKLAADLLDTFDRMDAIQIKLSDKTVSDRDKARLTRELSDLRIKVKTDLDSAAARASLIELTRDRILKIKPVLDSKAVRSLGQSLAILSGGRIAAEIAGDFRSLLTNIDKTTVASGALAIALNTLGAFLVAMSGEVLAFGQSLIEIAPAALALPGILGGLAVGAAATLVAFKDFKKVLPDVIDDLKAMQEAASASFWSKAKKPFQEMADKILPKFAKGFEETAEASGSFFASLSKSLTRELGDGAIGRMFDSLNESIENFSKHTDGMASAIRILGEAGTRQLPGLATWFGKVSDKFAEFLENAERTGDIDRWIATATTRLQDLGGAIVGAGEVLGALFKAADDASAGDTFANMNKGLDELQRKLNSKSAQTALTNFFKAGHDAMENFVKGAGPGASRFVQEFSKSLEKTMPQLTGAFGRLLGDLFDMLASPEVQKGYQDFVGGLARGLDSLRPGVESLSEKLGPVLTLMGELAEAIGSVASAALQNLSPAIGELAELLTPFVDQLGGDLTQIIEDLAPTFEELADQIDGLGPEVQEVSDAFSRLADALGPSLQKGLPKIVTALGKLAKLNLEVSANNLNAIASSIESFNKAFDGEGGSATDRITSFVKGLGKLGNLDLWGTAAAADAVTKALESLLDSMGLDWDANSNIVANALRNIFDIDIMKLTPLGGLVEPIKQAFAAVDWSAIGRGVIDGIILGLVPAPLVEKAQELADSLINKVKELLGIHSPSTVFEEIGRNVVQGFVNGLADLTGFDNFVARIKAGVENLRTSVIQKVESLRAGVVQKFENLKTNAQQKFEQIRATVIQKIENLRANAIAKFESIKAQAVQKLENLRSNAIAKAESIRSNVVSKIEALRANLVGKWESVRATAASKWESIKNTIRDAAGQIKDAVSGKVDNVVAYMRGVPGKIKGALGDLSTLLYSAGSSVIQGLIDGIQSKIGDVQAKLQNLTAMLPDWKGPAPKDARLLTPAGELIMQSLIDGFENKFTAIRKVLRGLTDEIAGALDTETDASFSATAAVTSTAVSQGIAKAAGNKQSSTPPSQHSGGSTIENLNISLSLEDLKQLNDLEDFFDLLRVRTRMG